MKRLIPLAAIAALCVMSPAQDIVKSRLIAPADPFSYRQLVLDGINAYNASRSADAVPKFKQALDLYPLDGAVWIYYGHALRSAGQPKEAVAAYRKGLDYKSAWQPFRTYYWIAVASLQAGDKEGAYQALEHTVYKEPYVRRPDLIDDPAFASIKDEPRFLRVAGKVDTSKMSRTEGWRTDVDYMLAEIKRVNHKYKDEPLPAEVIKRAESLKRDVPKLSDDEVLVRLGNILEPFHMAHMSLALFPETKLTPGRSLPVKFYAFPEGIFIVGGEEKYTDLIGAEVLKIENTSPAEVLAMSEKNASVENEMKILWGVQGIAELQRLRGLGVVPKDKTDVRLTLRTKDGQTVERTLPTGAFNHPRKLQPLPGAQAPMFTRKVSESHWFEALPDQNAVFVQLNQVSNDPDESLSAFGLRLRKHLAENPTKNVILDVRHNNGGNTGLYPELLRTLIAHTTKDGNRLYVIIGRMVYSATGNLISDLERLASPIFVGEPSSGFGNQDGDESFTILPYSGVRGFLTSVWWQLSDPWDKRTSIVPDIPVQLTAKAFFEGKDPVLESVFEAIRRDK